MLLAVAVDSSWFTGQQHSELEEMLKDVVCGAEVKSGALDIAGLKTVLASKEEHVSSLQKQLEEKNKECSSLKEELAEVQARVSGAIESLSLSLKVQVNHGYDGIGGPRPHLLNNSMPTPFDPNQNSGASGYGP